MEVAVEAVLSLEAEVALDAVVVEDREILTLNRSATTVSVQHSVKDRAMFILAKEPAVIFRD